jgi:hypothetical protein
MSEHNPLDELAYQLEERKAAEAQARAERIKAEEALIEQIGLEDEGTRTVKTPWYKISTTAKLSRKLNAPSGCPDKVYHAIVRIKHELDVSAFKKLATNDPDAYRIACQAVETKPAKPEVKVERIEQQQEAA